MFLKTNNYCIYFYGKSPNFTVPKILQRFIYVCAVNLKHRILHFFFALKDFSLHIFQMAPLIREENIRLSKGTPTQFRSPVSLLPQTLTMELDTYYTKMQAQVGKIGCFPPLLIFCDNSLSIIGV
jgi:hypothetical protein